MAAVTRTEFDALASSVQALAEINTQILAHLAGDAPASVTPKARKASKKSTKTAKTVTCLTKGTRKAFVAQAKREGVDFDGYSTWEIAYHCVAEGYAPKGFRIGERYTELAVEAGA